MVAVHRAIKKYNDEAADEAIKGFVRAAKSEPSTDDLMEQLRASIDPHRKGK